MTYSDRYYNIHVIHILIEFRNAVKPKKNTPLILTTVPPKIATVNGMYPSDFLIMCRCRIYQKCVHLLSQI